MGFISGKGFISGSEHTLKAGKTTQFSVRLLDILTMVSKFSERKLKGIFVFSYLFSLGQSSSSIADHTKYQRSAHESEHEHVPSLP